MIEELTGVVYLYGHNGMIEELVGVVWSYWHVRGIDGDGIYNMALLV